MARTYILFSGVGSTVVNALMIPFAMVWRLPWKKSPGNVHEDAVQVHDLQHVLLTGSYPVRGEPDE